MSERIEFTVIGEPVPKGSLKAYVAPGTQYAKLTHDNARTKPWCSSVEMRAYEAYHYEGSPREIFTGPVVVHIDCYFNRPQSHYGTGKNEGTLKGSSPRCKTTKPDVDKLARAILDAMTGVIYRDDSQVVKLVVQKNFTDSSERAIVKLQLIGIDDA